MCSGEHEHKSQRTQSAWKKWLPVVSPAITSNRTEKYVVFFSVCTVVKLKLQSVRTISEG